MLHILTLVLYLKLSNTLIFTLLFHWYWHCFRGSAGRIFGCLVVRVVFCNCQLLGISIPLGMVHCKSWTPLLTHLCTYWPRTVVDRKQTYKREAKKQNIINKPDYPFLSLSFTERQISKQQNKLKQDHRSISTARLYLAMFGILCCWQIVVNHSHWLIGMLYWPSLYLIFQLRIIWLCCLKVWQIYGFRLQNSFIYSSSVTASSVKEPWWYWSPSWGTLDHSED